MNPTVKRILEISKEKGVSDQDLCRFLGSSKTKIHDWKRGHSKPTTEETSKIAEYLEVSPVYLLGLDEARHPNIIPIRTQRIPLLGNVACGEPVLAAEQFDSYVESGTEVKADFALRCKGDSMINARILDGDIVFIRRQPMVDNGQIACVAIDNEVTLKRFYRHDNTVSLVAENPSYPPIIYIINEHTDNIHILGRAVAFQSDVR